PYSFILWLDLHSGHNTKPLICHRYRISEHFLLLYHDDDFFICIVEYRSRSFYLRQQIKRILCYAALEALSFWDLLLSLEM
ncbi:hypothetical protein ACTHQ2_22455, partial [Bacillus subtilis]|uniref:hypothetical protein n=1 Tax=Bacillus subtilis TaxID=1423 RepID=UPI003F7BA2A3